MSSTQEMPVVVQRRRWSEGALVLLFLAVLSPFGIGTGWGIAAFTAPTHQPPTPATLTLPTTTSPTTSPTSAAAPRTVIHTVVVTRVVVQAPATPFRRPTQPTISSTTPETADGADKTSASPAPSATKTSTPPTSRSLFPDIGSR